MCAPKVKQAKVEPVAAPPPPSQAADAVQSPEDATGDASMKAKRRGRSALKIPLDAGVGGAGTGLNIPRA